MTQQKIKRGIRSFFSGDFITRWKLDKYVGFVLFIFCLVSLFIIWNLSVESRLVRVVDGENRIKELKIYRDQTSIELLRLDQRTIVEELLEKNNSKLIAPKEPATIIEGGKR